MKWVAIEKELPGEEKEDQNVISAIQSRLFQICRYEIGKSDINLVDQVNIQSLLSQTT